MKKPDAMWWSAPFSDDLLQWLQVTKVLQDALVGSDFLASQSRFTARPNGAETSVYCASAHLTDSSFAVLKVPCTGKLVLQKLGSKVHESENCHPPIL